MLCEPDLEEHELLALIHRCRELSLKVSVLPQLFSALGPSVEVDDVEGVTVLGINPPDPVALVPLPEARFRPDRRGGRARAVRALSWP